MGTAWTTQRDGDWSLISTNASSPWYDNAAQTALAAVPGDGDFVNVAHAVVIDQNIGTTGNGIKRIHIYGASASLTVNTAAARTIYFASSGSDPVGTGTGTNPGDDATMFGFFVAYGTLNLTGTAANPVTVTSGDDTNPIYIHHERGDVDFAGAAKYSSAYLTLKYCVIEHVGANVALYYGVCWSMHDTCTATIQNCQFDDCYMAVRTSQSAKPITITDCQFNSLRSTNYIYFTVVLPTGNNVSNNTFQPGAVGATCLYCGYTPIGLTFSGNALYASGGTAAVLFNDVGNVSGTPLNLTANDNIVYNTTQGGTTFNLATTASAAVDGLIMFNTNYGLWLKKGPHTISHVFVRKSETDGGVHAPILCSSGVGHVVQNCVVVYDTISVGVAGLFTWEGDSGNPAVGITYDHNTLIQLAGAGQGKGMTWGNGTAADAVTASQGRSNLVVGFYYGIYDFPGPVDGSDENNYTADVSPAVGVHHNATYDCDTPYFRTAGEPWSSSKFDDGTNAHPDASYGDIDGQDPGFVDTTRTLITWATSVGATGTDAQKLAWVFAEFAKRTGINGVSPDADVTYDNIETYLFAGFAPTNPQLHDAGHDNVTIGAIEYAGDAETGTYLLTAPTTASGKTGHASQNFTISLDTGQYPGTIIFTPVAADVAGTFTPTTVTLNNLTRSGTFTFTPTSPNIGTATITTTNDGIMTDPVGVEYEVILDTGVTYTQTNISMPVDSTKLMNRNSVIFGTGGAFFPEYGNFDVGIGSGSLVDLYNTRFFGRDLYRRDRTSKQDP